MFASRHHTHRVTTILFSTCAVLFFQTVLALPGQALAFEVFVTAQPQPADGETDQPTRQRPRRIVLEDAAGLPKPTVVLAPGEVPQIDFETPSFSIGRVMAGKVVRHDFLENLRYA